MVQGTGDRMKMGLPKDFFFFFFFFFLFKLLFHFRITTFVHTISSHTDYFEIQKGIQKKVY